MKNIHYTGMLPLTAASAFALLVDYRFPGLGHFLMGADFARPPIEVLKATPPEPPAALRAPWDAPYKTGARKCVFLSGGGPGVADKRDFPKAGSPI